MLGLENPVHLLFLLVVMLMLFGAKRLPEMGKSLGSSMRGFKDALQNPTPGELSPATPSPLATAVTEPEPTAVSAG
jgi:sec-independent protein translocase protein TatA